MDGKSRTCGRCRNFFTCVAESGEILGAEAKESDHAEMGSIPACSDFEESTHGKPVGLVEKVRDLAHDAQHRGEASPLIVAALELAEEYEALVRRSDTISEKINEVSALLEAAR